MDETLEPAARAPRINELLQQYWHELAGARPYPLESEISTEALRDIWPYCYLVSVKPDGFSYDYLGTGLIEAYGDDFTGREVTERLLYPHPTSLVKTFAEVVNSAQASMDENEFTNSRGARVKYRACVLPLGARGREGVAFLLGGMKWKAF
ncbi:MAG: PAS domain-containing protein [Rickettsiales bacterium]